MERVVNKFFCRAEGRKVTLAGEYKVCQTFAGWATTAQTHLRKERCLQEAIQRSDLYFQEILIHSFLLDADFNTCQLPLICPRKNVSN